MYNIWKEIGRITIFYVRKYFTVCHTPVIHNQDAEVTAVAVAAIQNTILESHFEEMVQL